MHDGIAGAAEGILRLLDPGIRGYGIIFSSISTTTSPGSNVLLSSEKPPVPSGLLSRLVNIDQSVSTPAFDTVSRGKSRRQARSTDRPVIHRKTGFSQSRFLKQVS